jgi:uncharacterized membrane protein YgcG
VRIEVGYGLEGSSPDGRVGWIIRNVMGPDLRQNRFGAGLLRGTEAVAAIIAKDAGVTLTRPGAVEVPAVGVGPKAGGLGVLLFILFLIIVMSAITSRHRRTRGWGDWRTRRGADGTIRGAASAEDSAGWADSADSAVAAAVEDSAGSAVGGAAAAARAAGSRERVRG